ncbi:MAG TPA: ABC transporter permease subunit [Bacilli bacterium]|nr:ABC transporter permease subunit [Bacilli bacterium]
MNILRRELKVNFKYTLIWTCVILSIALLTISFYPLIKNDIAEFQDIMKNFPTQVQAIFNLEMLKINNILGYYISFPIRFITLCMMIYSMILGINIISKEKRLKTLDFIYSKPITRFKLFNIKIVSALLLTTISNIILFFLIYFILIGFDNNVNMYTYSLINFSIYLISILYISLGLIISFVIKNVKNNITISLAIVIGLNSLAVFMDEKVRFCLPLRYFDMNYIYDNKKYELKYLILCISLTICFYIISNIIHKNKDIL